MKDVVAASGIYRQLAGCSLIRIGEPFALTVPDEVLDLEAIRPVLLLARACHQNDVDSRLELIDQVDPHCEWDCEWCQLSEEWKRWAEGGNDGEQEA
jgi:hypothetical protein